MNITTMLRILKLLFMLHISQKAQNLTDAKSYMCLLEEEHDRVHRVISSLGGREQDTMEVELKDGERDVGA